MDLSFLLPTNTVDRDPKDFALKVINNINSIQGLETFRYEILVYSPTEVAGKNVRWVKEESFSDGCVAAYNKLIINANGKYLIQAGDDYYFDNKFCNAINLLNSPIFSNRKFKMVLLGSSNGVGAYMPPGYPRYLVCRYPIIAKETVMTYLHGHLFHPQFKNHYADNWLGYWITCVFDEPIIELWDTIIHLGPATSYNTHNNYDSQIFAELIKRFHTTNYKNYI